MNINTPTAGKDVIVKLSGLVSTVLMDHSANSMVQFSFLSTCTSPEQPVGTILTFTTPILGDQFY